LESPPFTYCNGISDLAIGWKSASLAHNIYLTSSVISPSFIFWGRIHKQKRLDNALYFFSEIYTSNKDASFIIIGPDCGDLKSVRNLVSNLKLSSAVHFMGPLSFDNIKILSANASFYLQTSELEGMALSVVEAMQLGLVPIVTPVGEIKNYCVDGFNAIFITKNNWNAIDNVRLLLSNVEDYNKFRYNSISSWNNKITYKDDVFNKCLDPVTVCVAPKN
jgi:glycosyltransferase involved in cell wall biosynthesis